MLGDSVQWNLNPRNLNLARGSDLGCQPAFRV